MECRKAADTYPTSLTSRGRADRKRSKRGISHGETKHFSERHGFLYSHFRATRILMPGPSSSAKGFPHHVSAQMRS